MPTIVVAPEDTPTVQRVCDHITEITGVKPVLKGQATELESETFVMSANCSSCEMFSIELL